MFVPLFAISFLSLVC